MTEKFVKGAGGDCFVGITDLHPGADGLVSLRGPEKWYVTSSDFIYMISEDMFEEFIIPELVTEIDWLDNVRFSSGWTACFKAFR